VSNSWQACLGGGAAATVAYTQLPAGPAWRGAGYAVLGVACIAVILGAVRRHRPQQPAPWYALVAAIGAWLVNSVLDQVATAAPWPLVSALFGLAGYALVYWCLIILLRGRTRAVDRTTLIDGGIVATSLGLLYWTVALTGLPGSGPAHVIESLTYAVGDITLFVLVALLVTAPGGRTTSYRLLAAALVAMAVGDILMIMSEPPFRSLPADVALLLSYPLIAAAAAHPSMRRLTVPGVRRPRFVRPRLALLVAAILVAPAMSLYLGVTGRIAEEWLPTGIACVLLLLLVTLRIAGLLHRVESQARRLERLANHDSLTGLANRRRWDERLPAAMADSEANGTTLIVGLIDLDHFKRYNDTHGHQAGDELLSQSAVAWLMTLREGDLLARYGGEEFAVLLSGHTMDEATATLERLMAATPLGQTFSAGLAGWDGREGPEDLLRRADELMYDAKHAGRARIFTNQGVSLVR
jgi:diguanylate cyclase (GGDEF)-like protein